MTKRYTTVERATPSTWGIFSEGKDLSTYEVCHLLNDYEDENNELKKKIEVLLKGWKKIDYCGLLNLMKDYNLNWDSVYEIMRDACENEKV